MDAKKVNSKSQPLTLPNMQSVVAGATRKSTSELTCEEKQSSQPPSTNNSGNKTTGGHLRFVCGCTVANYKYVGSAFP